MAGQQTFQYQQRADPLDAWWLNDPNNAVPPLSWEGRHAPVYPRAQQPVREGTPDFPWFPDLPTYTTAPWEGVISQPQPASFRPFRPDPSPSSDPTAAQIISQLAVPFGWYTPPSEPERREWRPFVPFHPAMFDAGPAFFLNDPNQAVPALAWFQPFTEPRRTSWRRWWPDGHDYSDPTGEWFIPGLGVPALSWYGHWQQPTPAAWLRFRNDGREYSDPTFGALVPSLPVPGLPWLVPEQRPVRHNRVTFGDAYAGTLFLVAPTAPTFVDAPSAHPSQLLWARPRLEPAQFHVPLAVWVDAEPAFMTPAETSAMPWLRQRRPLNAGGEVNPGLQPPAAVWFWSPDVARPTRAQTPRLDPITVQLLSHGVVAPIGGWAATPDLVRPTPAQSPRLDPTTIAPVLLLATVPTGDYWTPQPVPLFPGPRRQAGGTVETLNPDRVFLTFGWEAQAPAPFRSAGRPSLGYHAGPLMVLPAGFQLEWIGVPGVPLAQSWRPFRPEGTHAVYPLAAPFTVDALHWHAPQLVPVRRGWQPRADHSAPVLPLPDADTLAWYVQGPVPDRRPVAGVRLDGGGSAPMGWYGVVTLYVVAGPYRVVTGQLFVAGPVQGDILGE